MRTTNRWSGLSGNDEAHASAITECGTLGRVRLKLWIFAGASVVAVLVGLPGWTQCALVATTLMIPGAVAAQSGRNQVWMIFLSVVMTRGPKRQVPCHSEPLVRHRECRCKRAAPTRSAAGRETDPPPMGVTQGSCVVTRNVGPAGRVT